MEIVTAFSHCFFNEDIFLKHMQGPKSPVKPVPLGVLSAVPRSTNGAGWTHPLWWSDLLKKRHFNRWKHLPLTLQTLSCIWGDKGEEKKQHLPHDLLHRCPSLVLYMMSSQPFFFPCPGHSPAAHPHSSAYPRQGQKGLLQLQRQDLTHPLHLCWLAAPPCSRPGSSRWYPRHSQPSRRQWRCWWLSLAPEVWQSVSVGLRGKSPIVIHNPVFSAKLPTNAWVNPIAYFHSGCLFPHSKYSRKYRILVQF